MCCYPMDRPQSFSDLRGNEFIVRASVAVMKPDYSSSRFTSLGQIAAQAGMIPSALRVTPYRMHGHFRDHIKRELAASIDSDDSVLIREEMAELFKV